MKIIIEGTAKEIADLAEKRQSRQAAYFSLDFKPIKKHNDGFMSFIYAIQKISEIELRKESEVRKSAEKF